MDAIEIADPTFALDIVDNVSEQICETISDIIDNVATNNSPSIIASPTPVQSSSYWFIGGLLLLLFVGMFAYKKLVKNNNTDNDCIGGFCSMNNPSSEDRNEEN